MYTRYDDRLVSIHGHTSAQSRAREPLDLERGFTSSEYTDHTRWVYVPIAAGDEVLAIALAVDPVAAKPENPSFYVRASFLQRTKVDNERR